MVEQVGITEEQLLANKESFLKLIQSIKRPGADIEGLVNKLQSSDFFIAPASTRFHCAYRGGLCQHSLNVYEQMKTLANAEHLDIDPESLLIVGLLHDISKMNFYEIALRNNKTPDGKWEKVPFIKVKDDDQRFLYGSHEQTSLYMTSTFIPLKLEEEIAILNHMGGKGYDSTQADLTPIYNRYPLVILTHLADSAATFLTEALI